MGLFSDATDRLKGVFPALRKRITHRIPGEPDLEYVIGQFDDGEDEDRVTGGSYHINERTITINIHAFPEMIKVDDLSPTLAMACHDYVYLHEMCHWAEHDRGKYNVTRGKGHSDRWMEYLGPLIEETYESVTFGAGP